MSFITSRFKILGDSAYPDRPYLIKASPDISQESARSVIENCFGQLKSQWRCLLKPVDVDVLRVPHIFITCSILFNICKEDGI